MDRVWIVRYDSADYESAPSMEAVCATEELAEEYAAALSRYPERQGAEAFVEEWEIETAVPEMYWRHHVTWNGRYLSAYSYRCERRIPESEELETTDIYGSPIVISSDYNLAVERAIQNYAPSPMPRIGRSVSSTVRAPLVIEDLDED